MKLPPTRQFSCIERVNVPNLNRSICHLASTPKLQNDENKYSAFQELKKIKKRAGKEGQYDVNFLLKDYGRSPQRDDGRNCHFVSRNDIEHQRNESVLERLGSE